MEPVSLAGVIQTFCEFQSVLSVDESSFCNIVEIINNYKCCV